MASDTNFIIDLHPMWYGHELHCLFFASFVENSYVLSTITPKGLSAMVLIGLASKLCLKDQLWFTSTLNRKISAEIGQSQCWDRLCQNDSSHDQAAFIAPLTCP